MRTFIFILIITFLSSCSATRNSTTEISNTVKSYKSYRSIYNLASDQMAGRVIGTPGIQTAAIYIASELKSAGIETFFKNTYMDRFMIDSIMTSNIIGVINSNNSSDEYIMLSAHYDHISGKPKGDDAIYNGANDNASGVSSVIEIGKILNKHKSELKKNVLLVLFSGEESGLKGSIYLADKLKTQGVNLVYQLNYEMVGVPLNVGENKVFMTGYNMSNMAKQMNTALEIEFVVFDSNAEKLGLFMRSDNYPFYQEYNIPAHSISSFAFKNYDYYHHVDDEIEALDFRHIDTVIDLSAKALLEMLKQNTKIELNESN